MPAPELFKYFPHDLPVLQAHFLGDEEVITLTKSTIRLWIRPGGPESDFQDFTKRLDEECVDFVLFESRAYVLHVSGHISVVLIDKTQILKDSAIDDEQDPRKSPFKVSEVVKFTAESQAIRIQEVDGEIFFLLKSGDLIRCPIASFNEQSSTIYTMAKPNKATFFTVQSNFCFVATKADVKVFKIDKNFTIEPFGYLSRDIRKADISMRNTMDIKFDGKILIQGDNSGHFSLWTYENEQFNHIFTQWQHGSGISSISCSFDKLIGIGMDLEGCGVIYSLRKAEVLEKWVLHSGRVNSSQIASGRLLTSSEDYTAKIWLLWR